MAVLMNQTTIDARFKDALSFHQRGDFGAALSRYQAILQERPKAASIWHHAAMAFQQLGDFKAAQQAIDSALSLEPANAAFLILAGNVAQDLKQPALATSMFLRATEVAPDSPQAFNNLGIAYRDQGDSAPAKAAFQRAVALQPTYARGLNNLAAMLIDERDYEQATTLLQRAIAADSRYPFAYVGLARALLAQGKFTEAERAVEGALTVAPNLPDAWLQLGLIHRDQQHIDQAIASFQQGLVHAPRDERLLRALATEAGRAGDLSLAQQTQAQLQQMGLISVSAAIDATLVLPQAYDSVEHLRAVRAQFTKAVESLQKHDLGDLPVPQRLQAVIRNNFFLAYQGENDREIQETFANWQASELKEIAPHLFEPISAHRHSKRLRVGFVSGFLHTSTAGLYFEHWMTGLPLSEFEVFVWEMDGQRRFADDSLRLRIREHVSQPANGEAQHFFSETTNLIELGEQIKSQQLDVLIYPELGMRSDVYTLASLRLAPLQCMGWGHPVTSGHANIDVAFSSELMERTDIAQSHYREQLVTLPGIGTCYRHAGVPQELKPRAAFQLPHREQAVLALYPQSLFKIRPENDALMIELLKQNPKLVLVMFQGQSGALTQTFVSRMSKRFAAANLPAAGRIKMLPAMDHNDYLTVCSHCDFMLDTLFWSGGNTSLDAIACGLPIVTLPGDLMRSRQSAAMLMLMGLDELVADSESSYIRIASRLASDSSWRDQLRERIRAGRAKVFDDRNPIDALASWLKAQVAVHL
jgi:protein O-GlcNAc transferase